MGLTIARSAADMSVFSGSVLVPTMGALHAGHLALIERAVSMARDSGRAVVVSVFVNPTQFNESSDFETYPRDEACDVSACEQAGVDCVFAPRVDEMYLPGVDAAMPELPPQATEPGLEDAHRPGHFAGVCQVCRRLFELTQASAALFGEKDWQQLVVVREMAMSLGMPIEVVGHPTQREPDGLAMSSRNVRMTAGERQQATALSRALVEAGRCNDAGAAERAGLEVCRSAGIQPEYFAVRDAQTLGPIRARRAARVLVAGWVGAARLLDNAVWPGFTLGS